MSAWSVILLMMYFVVGSVVAGVTVYYNRLDNAATQRCIGVLTVFGWPILLISVACYCAYIAAGNACIALGRAVGHRQNRGKIASMAVRMYEDDLKRVNGNELALRIDYVPCPKCYGSGDVRGTKCDPCNGLGVRRQKVDDKRPVDRYEMADLARAFPAQAE